MAETPFGLAAAVVERMRAVLAGHPAVTRALVYGSRAKGNFWPASDIDLTLEGETLTHAELLDIANDLDDLSLPQKIDLSLLREIDNPDLLDHIRRVGIVFFSSGHVPAPAAPDHGTEPDRRS